MILIILLLIICAVAYIFYSGNTNLITGSGELTEIVIDTLNLFYEWRKGKKLNNKLPREDHIMECINSTAPVLKELYSGKITYVLKDVNYETMPLQQCAEEHNIVISITVNYANDGITLDYVNSKSDSHAALGRDDFYINILAKSYNCAILSNDNYRDIEDHKKTLQPFYVLSYTYWTYSPVMDYIRPQNYNYIRAQKRVKINKIKGLCD